MGLTLAADKGHIMSWEKQDFVSDAPEPEMVTYLYVCVGDVIWVFAKKNDFYAAAFISMEGVG